MVIYYHIPACQPKVSDSNMAFMTVEENVPGLEKTKEGKVIRMVYLITILIIGS